MKKKNFVMLVLGTVGGLLFSLGMCMCLLPEWNAFEIGVGCTGAGLAVLLALLAFARKGKPKAKVNWKLAGKIAFGVAGALVLGIGMSMVLMFDMLLWGIVVGLAGILMLLCLIPMCIGLK